MRAAVFAGVGAAIVLAPTPALAGGADQFILEARTAWTILGTRNPTGGFTPGAGAFYLFGVGEGAALGLGADIGVFGFGGAARWIGVLGGPTARFSLKAGNAPLAFSIGVAADFGRIPVCTPWDRRICPRFVGLFPSATLAAAYVSESGLMVGASFSARLVNTLIGTMGSYEPGLTVGFFLTRK